MGGIEDAVVTGVLDLKGLDDGAGRQAVNPEAATRHRLDTLDILPGHIGEDGFRAPRTLHFQSHGLRARYLRHRDCRGTGDYSAALEKLAARYR